jgi:RNA 2',3'-cyclic 3'-phosphodiesterase
VSERLRLFVALELPAHVRSGLAAWCETAAPDSVRRVPAANLHLTLAFLGSRSAEDGSAVAALLPGVARDVGTLETAGALWLPPRRPGVLTVALAAGPALAALQADLVAALADAIGFEPERRAFRPHVTVGRVPRGTRIAAGSLSPPALAFASPALTLYRSHTGGGGTRYEPLARRSLQGSGE